MARWCFVLVALVACASPAFASLGGSVASVEDDRVKAQAALVRISQTDGYTVHELQAPTGTAIREFVSPAGTVYGVAWQGPWTPNLKQVLGSYFEQYQAALRNQKGRRRRGPVSIETPDLVVQLSGHQRAFSGRAYVPQLVPQGVDTTSIR